MDWFLDPTRAEAARELRHELTEYLARHADGSASDLDAAELAVGELLGNVARHAGSAAWVELDWGGEDAVLRVRDLGPGFKLEEAKLPDDLLSSEGRGLFLVSHMTQALDVAARESGGSVVSAVLPVRRRPEESHDPPRHDAGALPAPEEARDDGTFEKESFLRAIVVQLAQHVEREHGPAAAAAAVAQVGADVGGRMEEAYRRVGNHVGRLSSSEMADLYLNLKWAIDGDFYVIEANEDRIVLGNRRCPFGDVVRRAPALCRMTSSVFGGIAARNSTGAAVRLEERIAVGDAGCRVVVELGKATADDADSASHHYAAPEPPD